MARGRAGQLALAECRADACSCSVVVVIVITVGHMLTLCVCVCVWLACMSRLQDQGAARQDEHVHQDSGARRRPRVRHHRTTAGRVARQTRDTLGRRPLQPDPRQPRPRLRSLPRRRPRAGGRSRDVRGARAGARGRPRRRTEGFDGEAHSAADSDLHRHAVARYTTSLRGRRRTRQRRPRQVNINSSLSNKQVAVARRPTRLSSVGFRS